ncbi:hypothetical protein FKW77_002330 [Venturia effusa]|uniref:Alpha/beta hydrolase fold-3 domain-containing protein n=1 Tax=Venturia effusa TaxID=50376 RepID=A0A517LNH0_9PEZI|nr:hypothetical protein FKW77_002330 [Venturia effusa]
MSILDPPPLALHQPTSPGPSEQPTTPPQSDPPEIRLLLKTTPVPTLSGNVLDLRKVLAQAKKALNASHGGGTDGVKDEDITIPARDGYPIPARIYKPTALPSGGSPLVVFYHGGGFALGGLENEELNCRNFARTLGCTCVNVDYRLAPEHPFPTAAEDCWDATQWAATNASKLGADPSKGFIVGGTSAGGNLAAVVSHLARDEKLSPPITGVSLLIPALTSHTLEEFPEEYKHELVSYQQNAKAPILGLASMDMLMDAYKPDPTSHLFNIFAAPYNFKDLPPTFFQICGMDPLRDEAMLYERLLREMYGAKTLLKLYPGLPHAFWSFSPTLKASGVFVQDTTNGVRWLLEQRVMILYPFLGVEVGAETLVIFKATDCINTSGSANAGTSGSATAERLSTVIKFDGLELTVYGHSQIELARNVRMQIEILKAAAPPPVQTPAWQAANPVIRPGKSMYDKMPKREGRMQVDDYIEDVDPQQLRNRIWVNTKKNALKYIEDAIAEIEARLCITHILGPLNGEIPMDKWKGCNKSDCPLQHDIVEWELWVFALVNEVTIELYVDLYISMSRARGENIPPRKDILDHALRMARYVREHKLLEKVKIKVGGYRGPPQPRPPRAPLSSDAQQRSDEYRQRAGLATEADIRAQKARTAESDRKQAEPVTNKKAEPATSKKAEPATNKKAEPATKSIPKDQEMAERFKQLSLDAERTAEEAEMKKAEAAEMQAAMESYRRQQEQMQGIVEKIKLVIVDERYQASPEGQLVLEEFKKIKKIRKDKNHLMHAEAAAHWKDVKAFLDATRASQKAASSSPVKTEAAAGPKVDDEGFTMVPPSKSATKATAQEGKLPEAKQEGNSPDTKQEGQVPETKQDGQQPAKDDLASAKGPPVSKVNKNRFDPLKNLEPADSVEETEE